jgi:hypothetical protein
MSKQQAVLQDTNTSICSMPSARLAGGRVPVLQLCIIRSSISFCTSIAAGTASGIKPLFGQRQHFPLLFLRGFFGTLAISTSYLALLSLPLGDAVTIAQVRECGDDATAVHMSLCLCLAPGLQLAPQHIVFQLYWFKCSVLCGLSSRCAVNKGPL